ncbi:MAG: LuxR C-terminal-related transcriptional regulator [Rhodococcus sp. (in: high G+C Gram-positive bacteria)]
MALAAQWDEVFAEIRNAPRDDSDADRHRALTDALSEIRAAEALVTSSRERGAESRFGRIHEAVWRLNRCTTSDQLLTSAAREICTIGFDRALVARVADERWNVHHMHDEIETSWASDLVAQGKESPPHLDGTIVESDTVSDVRARMVFDVQDNPRVAKSLVRIGRTESYCVAPLSIGKNVFGLIHGDCYHQGRRVDAQDRRALSTFADALSHSLARVTVLERAALVQEQMRTLTGDIQIIQTPAGSGPDLTKLSRRERDVAELVATGESNRGIARRLDISEATVKTHLTHVFRKLEVTSRAELLATWPR